MPSEKSTKEKLQSYFFDGAWSLGLASLITRGMISPLTLLVAGGLFTMQALGGFPVTRILSNVRDFAQDLFDRDYKPTEPNEEFYQYKSIDRNAPAFQKRLNKDPNLLERLSSTSKDHDFKYDFTLKAHDPINDPNAPIKEGIRAQLFETQVDSYLPAKGIRRIPGMTWLLGEQAVRYTLPTLNPVEINNMTYGRTRSGNVNFKPTERTDSVSTSPDTVSSLKLR